MMSVNTVVVGVPGKSASLSREKEWINYTKILMDVSPSTSHKEIAPKKSKKSKKLKLWIEQKGLCAYCDQVLEKSNTGTLDHIIPKSKGGKRGKNLTLVCVSCNQFKGNYASYDEALVAATKLVVFFKRLQRKGFTK